MKQCIACGMPMNNPEDFALGDTGKDYCRFCCHEEGTMQTYDEKLLSLKNFIMKTQGFEENVAVSAAKSMMSKLPAWKSESSTLQK